MEEGYRAAAPARKPALPGSLGVSVSPPPPGVNAPATRRWVLLAGIPVLALAAAPARALGKCRIHPPDLHRLSRDAAETVLHPPGRHQELLRHMARSLAASPGLPPVPECGPSSGLAGGVPLAARLERILAAMVWIESRGMHRRPDGSLVVSSERGDGGFVMVSPGAAEDALVAWRRRGLRPVPPPGPVAATAGEIRRDPGWNLGLGLLYLLLQRERIEAATRDPDPELAWMRAFAAYVGGASQPYLLRSRPEFLEGVSERPEVKRYVRHASFALGLAAGDPEDFVAAVSGRLTREAGTFAAERAAIRRHAAGMLLPCEGEEGFRERSWTAPSSGPVPPGSGGTAGGRTHRSSRSR